MALNIFTNISAHHSLRTEHIRRGKKGVTLFIAILMSSIVLSIGTSVMNITLKEISLASLGGASAKAFHTADTGLECALLWDLNTPAPFTASVFATSSQSIPPASGSGVWCAGTDVSSVWLFDGPPARTPTSATTTFTVRFSGNIGDPCADVSVVKYVDGSGDTRTKIESRGLNSCNPAQARRSERGIRIQY